MSISSVSYTHLTYGAVRKHFFTIGFTIGQHDPETSEKIDTHFKIDPLVLQSVRIALIARVGVAAVMLCTLRLALKHKAAASFSIGGYARPYAAGQGTVRFDRAPAAKLIYRI